MDMKPCPKCDSTEFYITVDKRGVPEARCRECDSYITKTNSQTMYDYFMWRLSDANAALCEAQEAPVNKVEKPICKYCTERWAILDGRMGVRPREMNDIKFCPMCGRELKPTDKDY